MKKFLVTIALAVSASGVVVGCEPQSAERWSSASETTPAYGVLVLRKVAIESELADLSSKLTNEHPRFGSKRFELRALKLEMDKIRAVDKSRVGKLSNTFGELVLSKVALEVELNELLVQLKSSHPDVKRKTLELAALQREIENLLR